jgi:hypothetical protein
VFEQLTEWRAEHHAITRSQLKCAAPTDASASAGRAYAVLDGLHLQAGYIGAHVRQLCDVKLVYCCLTHDTHRTRHVLDILGALVSGNDYLGQLSVRYGLCQRITRD